MQMNATQSQIASSGENLIAKIDSRWVAVQSRNRVADGAFVYAVRSTGVYCRPSCPSRKPRRVQVMFFGVPSQAERAGFRACLRCRPDEAKPADPHAADVARICRHIETTLANRGGDESS